MYRILNERKKEGVFDRNILKKTLREDKWLQLHRVAGFWRQNNQGVAVCLWLQNVNTTIRTHEGPLLPRSWFEGEMLSIVHLFFEGKLPKEPRDIIDFKQIYNYSNSWVPALAYSMNWRRNSEHRAVIVWREVTRVAPPRHVLDFLNAIPLFKHPSGCFGLLHELQAKWCVVIDKHANTATAIRVKL